jgi:hypothetical protein
MHRGTDFDDLRWKRDMQRATVSDVANSCEQEGVVVAAAQQAQSPSASRWDGAATDVRWLSYAKVNPSTT